MIAVLLGLAGERLKLGFERIDARGEVDDRGIALRAFAGRVVGRDLALEESGAAAGEDRALDRPHFLFQSLDALVDPGVLRLCNRRRCQRDHCRADQRPL